MSKACGLYSWVLASTQQPALEIYDPNLTVTPAATVPLMASVMSPNALSRYGSPAIMMASRGELLGRGPTSRLPCAQCLEQSNFEEKTG
jgi:hypothetical protein